MKEIVTNPAQLIDADPRNQNHSAHEYCVLPLLLKTHLHLMELDMRIG